MSTLNFIRTQLTSDLRMWICLAAMLVINKILILYKFGFAYVGSDDLILWQAALDYMNDIFREPYFYGQNYNFALESLLAVPLLATGLPPYIALPTTTVILSLFPFLFFSIVLLRNGHVWGAFAFLLIPLAMPIEYDIITALPRGFVTGLFFCSFLVFPLINPTRKSSFIILGFAVSLAYIVNPNAMVFCFPIYLLLLFKNYEDPLFYIISLVSAAPALLIEYISKQFYTNNPEYLVHIMWDLVYNFDWVIEGFTELDVFFRYLTPFYWGGNWLVVFLIIILGFTVIKKDWRKGAALILSTLFIILLLGVNKIHDDIGVIFLSSTRMFLALPLLFGLSVFWTHRVFRDSVKWRLVVLSVGLAFFLLKAFNHDSVIHKHTQEKNFGPIAIKKTDDLIRDCVEFQTITSHYDVDLVVYIPNWKYKVPYLEFYNYGCPVVLDSATTSVLTIYERRTWVFVEERNQIRNNILLFNSDPERIEEFSSRIEFDVISMDPCTFLIKDNDKTLKELSEIFDFPLLRNPY